jgi:hypothetical protein
MLPSDFFRRGVVLSFQEDAIGIRLRDVIGVDNMMWDNNMMWGSEYPHSESTFPQSRKILAEILEGVLDDEQAKPARDSDPGIAGGNTTRAPRLEEPTSADRRARRPRAVHRGRASNHWLDMHAVLPARRPSWGSCPTPLATRSSARGT